MYFLKFFIVGLFVVLCCSVVSLKKAAASEVPYEWFHCEIDSDCVVVGMNCAIHAVNEKFEHEAQTYYMELNTRMDCEDYLVPEDFIPFCAAKMIACVDEDSKDCNLPEKKCSMGGLK
jgi:hypothetical protein